MISDHIEKYYGISALDTLHNTALPLALQSSTSGEAQTILNKSDSTINDSSFTEFQLPLKGFYRHFKEMTETSMLNANLIQGFHQINFWRLNIDS